MPVGAKLIDNAVSAAPGFNLENLYVFAGVPKIMQSMFFSIKDKLVGGNILISQTISCNIGEGKIANSLEKIEKKYKVGEIYEGVVTKIMDYGCFVKIEEGIEGLIHNSELDWTNRNIKPSKVLSVSQNIKFKIVNIEKETKRISLSYKATLENPWEKIKEKIGEEVKIKVMNITDKAVFGELVDSGLSGMLHYKEISYDENLDDLKKFKKNDTINVKIIEIKDEKIRFSKRSLTKECAYTMIDTQYDINKKYMHWPPMNQIGGKCMEDLLSTNEFYDNHNHPNKSGHNHIAEMIYNEYEKIYL